MGVNNDSLLLVMVVYTSGLRPQAKPHGNEHLQVKMNGVKGKLV